LGKEVGRGVFKGGVTGYVRMGITVIFANGDERNVPAYMLDYLIREKKIVAFLRTDGWVQIGQDPIRKAQQPLTRSGSRWSDFMFKRTQQT
jgi:hypothetical protein